MAKTTSLDEVIARTLRGQTRVARALDLGGRRGTNSGFARAIYVHCEDLRLLACLEVNRRARGLAFDVGRYDARPAAGSDPLDTGRPGLAEVHVFYRDEADLEAKVSSLLSNFVRHADRLAWDPPSDRLYWEAFESLASERNAWSARLPDLLWWAILRTFGSQQAVAIGRGVGIVGHEVPEHFTVHGRAPAHWRIALAPLAPPTPEPYYRFGPKAVLSPVEKERLGFGWLVAGLARVDAGERWEILVPGPTYMGTLDMERPGLAVLPGPRLVPSKELVLAIQPARFVEFRAFIADLPEDAWRAAYDGTLPHADEEQTLRTELEKTPGDFRAYKRIADHFNEAGNAAQANLWLGLGYLRAHRVPGIAEAKLKLAAASDPHTAGLAAAFAELARLKRERGA